MTFRPTGLWTGDLGRLEVSLLHRHRDQVALRRVRPPVVRAAQRRGIPALDVADPVAAVGAPIGQDVDLTVPAAGHDHRLPAHMAGQIVPRLRQFAVVGDIHPSVGKNPLHF